MNFGNNEFKIGRIYGYMEGLTGYGKLSLREWIGILNHQLYNEGITDSKKINSIIKLFNRDTNTRVIDGIEYILIGEYEDEYNELEGIVFSKNGKVEFISPEEFQNLIDTCECDCCLMSWTDNPNEYGYCSCYCGNCGEDLKNCKYNCYK